MGVTKDQAQMLTALACASRPIGARQWNPDDVMAEVAKLHDRNLPSVVCAVIRAAMDRGAERPSVIPSAGSHWSDTMMPAAFVPVIVESTERCSICSMAERDCRARHSTDDHEFESAVMAAKRRAEADPEAVTTAINALKAGIEPTEVAPTKTLAELTAERPEFAARLAAIQAKHPSPPMREPEPQPEPPEPTAEPEETSA